MVIKPQFGGDSSAFSGGLAYVALDPSDENGEMGYVDRAGEVVWPSSG